MRTKLKENEDVLYVAHRHWIVLVPDILLCFLAVALIGYTKFVHSFEFLAFVIFLVLLAKLLYTILYRKYDIWVITNTRIIDEYGVLSHNFKENPLDKINNVNVFQSLTGRFLDYGTVEIQTAAEGGDTVIENVISPRTLQDVVLTAIQNREKDLHSSQQKSEKKDSVCFPDDAKECPQCAEVIRAKAKVCRFCGYSFGETNEIDNCSFGKDCVKKEG